MNMRTMVPLLVMSALLSFVGCTSVPASRACARDIQPPAMEVPPDAEAAANKNVVAPVVVRRVAPQADRSIPNPATATIEAIIGEDGVPRHICVVSGDLAWGRALAAAVRQWKFRPGTLDGKPVKVLFSLTSEYHGP
jgi:hypothetical protein